MNLNNFHAVMGNHDLLLLRLWEEDMLDKVEEDHQKQTVEELGTDIEKYMTFIAGFPYFLDLPECIVIHGGLRPGVPLEEQSLNDLVNLRQLEDGRPWYESYEGGKLVVYGHWAIQGLNVRKNTIGLDSGCVYGKSLSALVLPERKIISVPARKAHLPVG